MVLYEILRGCRIEVVLFPRYIKRNIAYHIARIILSIIHYK